MFLASSETRNAIILPISGRFQRPLEQRGLSDIVTSNFLGFPCHELRSAALASPGDVQSHRSQHGSRGNSIHVDIVPGQD